LIAGSIFHKNPADFADTGVEKNLLCFRMFVARIISAQWMRIKRSQLSGMRKNKSIGKFLLAAAAVMLWQIAVFAEVPFGWSVSQEGSKLFLILQVAPGYYLDGDTLLINAVDSDGNTPAVLKAPLTVEISDGEGGQSSVYKSGEWVWVLEGNPPYTLGVEFNGCRESADGAAPLCLPPETIQLLPAQESPAEEVKDGIESAAADIAIETSGFRKTGMISGSVGKAEFIEWLKNGKTESDSAAGSDLPIGVFGLIFAALIGGLALNLTPCVLPLIPVNLIIIGARNADRRTGFLRGLAYGGGMALAYGILGLAVILLGAKFGSLNSSAVFNFVISAIFVALAAAMAGAFNLDLASSFNRFKPAKWGKWETLFAAVMGVMSALLAGACVAPAVIAMLLLAANSYNDGNQFALFLPFLLGIGMGLPWPFAGMGLAVLPRPGKFMVWIKYFLAAVILAVGMWYFKIAVSLLPDGEFSAAAEVQKLQSALVESRESGKPAVVDLWAVWCKNCSDFEKRVLEDKEVISLLQKDFVFVKMQVEKLDDPVFAKLLADWQVKGLPSVVMLSAKGTL
jgi:thiol:disulfide interchange protein